MSAFRTERRTNFYAQYKFLLAFPTMIAAFLLRILEGRRDAGKIISRMEKIFFHS